LRALDERERDRGFALVGDAIRETLRQVQRVGPDAFGAGRLRAQAIMKKGEAEGICVAFKDIPSEVTNLEKALYIFPEVVARAYDALEPHHIATYLTLLASSFNSFYAGSTIVNKSDPYSFYRMALVEAFHQTMKNGLYLLGIETPKKM
jgi:arginyl-tRNA synthetase